MTFRPGRRGPLLGAAALSLCDARRVRIRRRGPRRNRGKLDQMIVELARQDSRVGRLKFVPFHDDIERVSDTVFRLVTQVLADARPDELNADASRGNIEQMRLAVRGRYEAEHPGRTVR